MARIHFFDGDKGGVGKSFVCDSVIQVLKREKIEFIPVEADRYNPDIATRNKDLSFKFAVFSDDASQTAADEIIDWAVEKPVIISLPSQVGIPLNRWLEEASFAVKEANLSKEIQFVRWFVINGTNESVKLFNKALTNSGSYCQFVLVKNWGSQGFPGNWQILETYSGLSEGIKKHKVKIVEFPELSKIEAVKLADRKIGLSEILADSNLGIMAKSRFNLFLKKVTEQIVSTGLIP